jgi:multidrug resistance protein MdtO
LSLSKLGPRPPRRASASPLVAFLRRELAPTPGRLGATLRLTLACTAATVPIMIHHIPHGLVVMIVMYLITKEDTTATLLGSVFGLLGVTLGLVLALLAWQIALETAWRLVFVFLFAAAGLYIGRIIVLGALGSAIGVPAAMAMVLPDIFPVPDPEAMTETVLWLWWCVALGLAVNLGVQLLLSPGDPLVLLRRALIARLQAVEGAARSLSNGGASRPHPPRPSLTSLTVAGTSEMLTHLKMASLSHAWARQHRPQLGALIGLIDQLVTAAAALEATGLPASSGETRQRLEWVAMACARTARALASTSAPRPDELNSVEPPSAAARVAAVPALTAMERVLREIAQHALPRRAGPRSGQAPAPERRPSLLLPDAFTNPEHVRSAIRGGLACLICDVLLVGFAYPGIYTSVITCFVVSLSTVGASTQKGILRFAGAAVGGGMGIFALMYILPHVQTLGGFWAVFAPGTAVAAWVNLGSPRVSYGGYQVGVAFYKVVLQGWGPVTKLTVARDRLVGIAFGLVVFGILERVLWPVRASDLRQQRFADVLRSLAALARLMAQDRPGAGWDREIDDLRRRIAQDLGDTQRLLEESKFELQAGEQEAFQRRVGDAQIIFLVLLSLAYQRRAPGGLRVSPPVAAHELEDAVASRLEELADPPRGRGKSPSADLDAALAAVEAALALAPGGVLTDETVVAVEDRRQLYQTLVRLVSQLDPWPVDRSGFPAVPRRDAHQRVTEEDRP